MTEELLVALRIRTIGQTSIDCGGKSISSSATVLFATALVLGVERGRRLQRDWLLELLWPGESALDARHNLRQMLYKLRRMGLDSQVDGDAVLVPAERVFLDYEDAGSADVDTELGSLGSPSGLAACPGYSPKISEAFAAWLDGLRERVEGSLRRRLVSSIASARGDGKWDRVERLARHCLGIDPLNEEATLALAEALALQGSKAKAIGLLDAYLGEVGGEGSAYSSVDALKKRIARNSKSESTTAGRVHPLIGRESEVAAFDQRLAKSTSGGLNATLLLGSAGIGKTRLVSELAARAAIRGMRSIVLTPDPADRIVSVGTFERMARALRRMNGSLGASPAALRVVEEISDSTGIEGRTENGSASVDDSVRTAAIIEICLAVLAEQPMILLIDDVDEMTSSFQDLLVELAGRARSYPLTLVCTAKGPLPELARVGFRARTLRPLSLEQSWTLLESATDLTALDPESLDTLRAQLVAITGGTPQHIIAIASELGESFAQEQERGLVPLARARLAELSTQELYTLIAAAVMSPVGTANDVRAVLQSPLMECAMAIESLSARGIILPLPGGCLEIPRFWIDVVCTSAAQSTLSLIRREAAERLAATPLGDPQEISRAVTASSLHEAEGSTERRLETLWQLASNLATRGLSEDALAVLAQAESEQSVARLQLDIDLLRARLLASLGQWDRLLGAAAGTAIERRRRSVPENDDGLLELGLISLEAEWRGVQSQEVSIERALSVASREDIPSKWRWRYLAFGARMSANWCKLDALSQSYRISQLLQQPEDKEHSSLLISLIYHTYLGDASTARDIERSIVDHADRSGSAVESAIARRTASLSQRWRGEITLAISEVSRAVDIVTPSRNYHALALCLDSLASLHLEARNVEAARAVLGQLEQTGMLQLSKWLRMEHAETTAHFSYRTGDYSTALLTASAALRDYGDALHPVLRGFLLSWSLRSAIRVGHRGAASTYFAELESVWSEQLQPLGGPDSVAAGLAEGLSYLGDRHSAEAFLRHYLANQRRRLDAFRSD